MSPDENLGLKGMSPWKSIVRRSYFLVGVALTACVVVLVISLAAMEVSQATNTMMKGERDHTVHLYGANHDFEHYAGSGDLESLSAYEEDLTTALGISGTFGQALESLETRSAEDIGRDLSDYSESISLDEGQQLVRLVSLLSSNARVQALVAKAAEINLMTQEYATHVTTFTAAEDEATRSQALNRAQELFPQLQMEVLAFNQGVTELNDWASRTANRLLWFVTLAVLVGGSLLAWRIVGKMDRSIRSLVTFSKEVAEGDLSRRLPTGSQDEADLMARAMNRICENFQKMLREIGEGSSTLASSLSQISSTASELATSSSETSSSVTQISTTLEEIRQTSHVSNEKAADVADRAEEMGSVADSGRRSVQDAIDGMSHIKNEMGFVAEEILKLSERTSNVEEIIDVVTDLADQSNLLSVNASIEAAKAGEEGRGFSVVAQEMRSLAEQSRQATQQVKGILLEIQSATGSAVMATERGSKAVEKGMDISAQSGESIQVMAETLEASIDSATQIAASVQQQLLGLDELVDAMANIRDAAAQNLDGIRQLESASADLTVVGQGLVDLTDRFKT